MTDSKLDVETLTDGIVTADDAVRLAALGMTVAAQQTPGVPEYDFHVAPHAYLATRMGTAGAIYTGKMTTRDLGNFVSRRVTELDYNKLRVFERVLFKDHLDEWVPEWQRTFAPLLALFERLGDRVERWGAPRECVGQAWALHNVMAQGYWRQDKTLIVAENTQPRSYRSLVKAVQQLQAAGADIAAFYEIYRTSTGRRQLERAVDASVFRATHPDIPWTLAKEMFV